MVHYADLVAVCKVVRCPWEEDGNKRSPCLIEIKVLKVLIGNEKDTELLVDWGDHTLGYKNITEGKEYVAFLRRWDAGFLDPRDKQDQRIKHLGTEINNNYERFNSEYWIREIINGEIVWTNNQKISIDKFTIMIQNQRKLPLPKTSVYRRYYKRFLWYWRSSPQHVPATVLVIAGVIFVVLCRKISTWLNSVSIQIWYSERDNIVQTYNQQITAMSTIWIALGTAWILTGMILFFV